MAEPEEPNAAEPAFPASASVEGLRFELDRLVAYDRQSVIAEIQRVVGQLSTELPVTRSSFDRISRVSSSHCVRTFGGWHQALDAAGLGHRYGGRRVSAKMRDQHARSMSDEQVLSELRRVAALTGTETVTVEQLHDHSRLLSVRVVVSRFGTWRDALDAAGLELSSRGRRWTDDDYFENLLAVWTHYGRAPKYAEMDRAPSRITSGGYAAKFGSWGQAKAAFVERVNEDVAADAPTPAASSVSVAVTSRVPPPERRSPSIGLRYQVLRRDRFRCVLCGRSPATDLTCVLHVDHVVPISRGGKTTLDNLRSTCGDCNVGRSNRDLD